MIMMRPFRALHYDPRVVGDLAAVIAPPYDVIDAAHLDRLYARSPYNVVRLILNREADRYAAAAANLKAWKTNGMLRQDADPCLYWYVQDFTVPNGPACQRSGLIGTVRLEPIASGNIRPHERTFASPKEDRLRLMQACRTNLSPIFGMYPHREDVLAIIRSAVADRAPWIDVVDDAAERHRVWRLADPDTTARVAAALRETTIFIADGHHRYETALTYRDQRRSAEGDDPDAPYNFILMYLASMADPGLVILPTHRVLHRLPTDSPDACLRKLEAEFAVEAWPDTPAGRERLRATLDAEKVPGSIGLRLAGRDEILLLRLRDPRALDERLAAVDPSVRHLDVTVLDAFVLRGLLDIDCNSAAQAGWLTYTHDDKKAHAAVRGEAAAVFFMRAPRVGEVEAVCRAGKTMPQKSTYFYPKLLSGLVFHPLDR